MTSLQVFVDLPAVAKRDAPESLHVRADDMPELRGEGYRFRVVLGDTNGVSSMTSPALPMTILDARLEAGGGFTHDTGNLRDDLIVYLVNYARGLTDTPYGALIAHLASVAMTDERFVAIQHDYATNNRNVGRPICERAVERG